MDWLIAVYAKKYWKSFLSIFSGFAIAMTPDMLRPIFMITLDGILDIIVKLVQIFSGLFAIIVGYIAIRNYVNSKNTDNPKQTKLRKKK